MGWLDDEQVELVTQSGDYTLKPLESNQAHALRVSIGMIEEEKAGETITAEHFYYLEVREVQEIDTSDKPGQMPGVLNGVIINHAGHRINTDITSGSPLLKMQLQSRQLAPAAISFY